MAEHDYIQDSPVQRLRNWILSEMVRGAGYALAFLLAIGLIYGVIWGIGQFLPDESKNAPPPMPYSALEAPLVVATA
ncbi:MAG: RC-LH1 core complex protein PufX [Roseinatronobacter sp.]